MCKTVDKLTNTQSDNALVQIHKLEQELERVAAKIGKPVEELIRILLLKLSVDLEMPDRPCDI